MLYLFPSNNTEIIFVGDDTTKNPFTASTCTQMDLTEAILGQEDCLHLHVYVPAAAADIENASLLPVIFWIHSGGFIFDSGSTFLYGPEHIMDYDVIVVSINYRLGLLGFMTLENDVMPTNLGLRDQILALEWVQDNIKYFGGDPKKVTIAGESSGGMSVMYLLMSHLARGLFSGAIIQSGPMISSYTSWDKRPMLYTKKFAEDLGKIHI